MKAPVASSFAPSNKFIGPVVDEYSNFPKWELMNVPNEKIKTNVPK
ncbi:MAG: hypothetical protein M5T52_07690 [Ignavibacteriaceae bacterium]|nr:hypothetical protein [Ignavibacteriaceae bacterium]